MTSDLERMRRKAERAEANVAFWKRVLVGAIGFQTVAILGAVLALSHVLKP